MAESKSLLEIVKDLHQEVTEKYGRNDVDFDSFHKKARKSFCTMWELSNESTLESSGKIIIPKFNIELIEDRILSEYDQGIFYERDFSKTIDEELDHPDVDEGITLLKERYHKMGETLS